MTINSREAIQAVADKAGAKFSDVLEGRIAYCWYRGWRTTALQLETLR